MKNHITIKRWALDGKLNLQVWTPKVTNLLNIYFDHPLSACFCCKTAWIHFPSFSSVVFGRQAYLKWFEGDIQWPEARFVAASGNRQLILRVGWHPENQPFLYIFMIWCINIIDNIGYAICVCVNWNWGLKCNRNGWFLKESNWP